MGSRFDRTVDEREVDFYAGLATTWWDKDGPFWPLHTLNALRLDYICDHLCRHFGLEATQEQPLHGLEVLDIGCGGGILSEAMAGLGANVTGIDVVDKNIQVARLHARENEVTIDYRVATVAEWAATGKTFDVVLNMEVVEHVADVAAFMRDCIRLVSENGVMFVATINRTWLAWLFAIVGAEYVLRWLPRGTHRWSMFRKPQEIEALLEHDGLTVLDSAGVAANPFARTLRQTQSTLVNYMMFCARAAAPA